MIVQMKVIAALGALVVPAASAGVQRMQMTELQIQPGAAQLRMSIQFPSNDIAITRNSVLLRVAPRASTVRATWPASRSRRGRGTITCSWTNRW